MKSSSETVLFKEMCKGKSGPIHVYQCEGVTKRISRERLPDLVFFDYLDHFCQFLLGQLAFEDVSADALFIHD